jgi:dUTP pyrophosphatase
MMIELVHPNAKMPSRATKGDAGLDVHTPEDLTIPSGGHAKVSLGWKCQFDEGWVLLVFNKSGHAVNRGLDKGAEVIDAGYRGEVHVHLFNHSTEDVTFAAGDKIAQVLLMPVWTGQPVEGQVSTDTERGAGGFGSTGIR